MGIRSTRPIVESLPADQSPPLRNPSDPDLPQPPVLPAASANNRSQSGLEAGAIIGRKWLLLDRVGRGAFGDIFLAECVLKGDPLYSQRVALKVEKLEVADEATVRAALDAEHRQKERERLTVEGRPADAAAPLQPPASPRSANQNLPAPTPPPHPSEPLSPLSPYPASTPSPMPTTPTGPAPVYMKRCIVKLEAVVLSKLQSSPAFPRFVEYGRDGPQQVAYLAMQLLGDNLLRLRRQQRKLRFSLPTVLRFGVAALRALQLMHETGFIHRDVKPSNFVVGVGADSGRVYVIDFGLARAYREKGSNAVIPPRVEIGGFRGTPRYASIFVHREEDLSRRDDLWSLLYILVEFVTGDLPWGSKRDKGGYRGDQGALPLDEAAEGLPHLLHSLLPAPANAGLRVHPGLLPPHLPPRLQTEETPCAPRRAHGLGGRGTEGAGTDAARTGGSGVNTGGRQVRGGEGEGGRAADGHRPPPPPARRTGGVAAVAGAEDAATGAGGGGEGGRQCAAALSAAHPARAVELRLPGVSLALALLLWAAAVQSVRRGTAGVARAECVRGQRRQGVDVGVKAEQGCVG